MQPSNLNRITVFSLINRGEINEKWESIALLINNFSKKVDQKINAQGHLLEQIKSRSAITGSAFG
jgi:uncharacterized lipoprotein